MADRAILIELQKIPRGNELGIYEARHTHT
jgi:hypothetical protein